MSTISIQPPSGGLPLRAPLGETRETQIRGSYTLKPGSQLDRIVVISGGIPTVLAVDHVQRTFTVTLSLASPGQVLVQAILKTRVPMTGGRTFRWKIEDFESNTLTVTLVDAAVDPETLILCQCVDSGNRVLVGWQVDAFDVNSAGVETRLGDPAVTDVEGRVSFRFRQSVFTSDPAGRNPNVLFRVSQGGNPFTHDQPGERHRNGVLWDLAPRQHPVLLHVPGARGFALGQDIRAKWIELGGPRGLLGVPASDEAPTRDGRGRYAHFAGGSIFWSPEWGALEVHGLIRRKWSELDWEMGFLGFPVTDELSLPGSAGGRYSLFEHGIVTWEPGQSEAVAGAHHYERIYAAVRAQILGRFFALGPKGRRNHPVLCNELAAPVPSHPVTPAEREEAERARWRMVQSVGENPLLLGSWLYLALAVEHDAGNAESTAALEAALATLDSLYVWHDVHGAGGGRLPLRWDAGIPTDRREGRDQFLDGRNGAYANVTASADIHHLPRRDPKTLENLLGPREAARWLRVDPQNHSEDGRHVDYWYRYRLAEVSNDEIVGLVTAYWAIHRLSPTRAMAAAVNRQAGFLGNYFADNAYFLVRPGGGFNYRGAATLPWFEFPIARALGSISGADFRSRVDFLTVMTRAGYWAMYSQPIARYQALSWSLAAVAAASNTAFAVGAVVGSLEGIFAQQVLSPGTLGAAAALAVHRDGFDVANPEEIAIGLLACEAPDKAALYRAFAFGAARAAPWKAWSVNFHAWLGLTGLDDPDPTMRNVFGDWFAARQANPSIEIKGQGSRMVFASGVAALLASDTASEERLVARLERAIVELFRDSYFEPKLPTGEVPFAGGPAEFAHIAHVNYENDPRTPYSPLDFLAGMAMAFWHAKRKTVATPRFPEPLSQARFVQWPKAVVPQSVLPELEQAGIPRTAIQAGGGPLVMAQGGYPLFERPLVPRRGAGAPQSWGPATVPMCDETVRVHATDAGDVDTGVRLWPGQEFQIDAAGDIFSGRALAPRNGPDGLPEPVHDARWPLFSGLDPAANAFCLLGRLNGYFRIGTSLPRQRWVYHDKGVPLTLRINDDGPGDGNGYFTVRIRVWAPAGAEGSDPDLVFRPPNVIRDGGVLRTTDPADLIEVTVEPDALAPTTVEFVLATPPTITWRKELAAAGSVPFTVWTQDATHAAANGLYRHELAGATLTFRKQKFAQGVRDVRVLGGLEEAPPGARITFHWVRD